MQSGYERARQLRLRRVSDLSRVRAFSRSDAPSSRSAPRRICRRLSTPERRSSRTSPAMPRRSIPLRRSRSLRRSGLSERDASATARRSSLSRDERRPISRQPPNRSIGYGPWRLRDRQPRVLADEHLPPHAPLGRVRAGDGVLLDHRGAEVRAEPRVRQHVSRGRQPPAEGPRRPNGAQTTRSRPTTRSPRSATARAALTRRSSERRGGAHITWKARGLLHTECGSRCDEQSSTPGAWIANALRRSFVNQTCIISLPCTRR
jgi:hypothetical protein